MRASKAMQDRVFEHKAVQLRLNTTVEDAYGDSDLAGLQIKDVVTGMDARFRHAVRSISQLV